MKTFPYHYEGAEAFAVQMNGLREMLRTLPHSAVLFHVYAECWCNEEMRTIRQIIREAVPEARLIGTASFGNIVEGRCSRDDIAMTAMVFEHPDTWVESLCYPLDTDKLEDSLAGFLTHVRQRPDTKAVEAFIMADVENVTHCCEILNALPADIAFFGGKSRFDHLPEAPKFVINDEGECVSSAAAFVVYGGSEIHIKTGMILGWNPLGRRMQVTKSQGDILCELDGRPAHELYYKYLHIKNDENFFFNTLEFPFLFYKDDTSVIRISHACLDDGSMVLGASIPENDYVRIAFGDANEIMRSVLVGGREFEAFRPDGILLHTCGCRRTYWGDEASNKETVPFEALAPTGGFYTAGELLRTDGVITEHNSTMVIAALREGDVNAKPPVTFGMSEADIEQGESVINRLSTFVAAAIDELDAANRELEHLSITDGLTGLLNRRETERRIRAELESCGTCLIMMDLDDFKQVNDLHGHQEGDHVLQLFSALLQEQTAPYGERAVVGRWGGEEFIILLKETEAAQAAALAEAIREGFARQAFPVSGGHSVSIGVTSARAAEDADAAISRADEAMYHSKEQGKNRVTML